LPAIGDTIGEFKERRYNHADKKRREDQKQIAE